MYFSTNIYTHLVTTINYSQFFLDIITVSRLLSLLNVVALVRKIFTFVQLSLTTIVKELKAQYTIF